MNGKIKGKMKKGKTKAKTRAKTGAKTGAKTRAGRFFAAGSILLVISGILTAAAANSESFAEWYSQHIYLAVTNVLSRLTGMASFSVIELLLYAGIILAAGTGIHALAARSGNRGEQMYRWFSGVFLTVSVLVLIYVLNCGINYHRTSFSEKSGIEAGTHTVTELRQTCEWLTEEVNRLSTGISRDGSGELELQGDIGSEAVQAMNALGEIYPFMAGYYPSPKPLLVSEILSYQSLTGIYSPFTVEANYNRDMPAYDLPFTLCHELSHLKGFMQEEEANFISFLACRESDSAGFRYSGTLSAWVYAMNALSRTDAEQWQEVRAKLDLEIETDLAANSSFWARYDGAVAEVSNKVNDTYLKANGQKDGVESYGKMVDLLVAYFVSLDS